MDRYERRNRFASIASPAGLTGGGEAYRLYPPENLVRFELSGVPGKATAACGLGIYRDRLLGEQFYGDAFTCEPVHQTLHRIHLTPDGLNYRAERGAGESDSEFLTSTDRWFRPVQARTGTDGALWVVDMYRYVIEHPRWIPQRALAELDVFAGQSFGRIYRVLPKGSHDPALPNLESKSDRQLTELLHSSNGTIRDLAHQMLLWRKASDAVPALKAIVKSDASPESKIQALGLLDGLHELQIESLLGALSNNHDEVVRHAVRLSESMLDESSTIRAAVLQHAMHANPRVRRQVAWSLGAASHDSAVETLTLLASKRESDAYVRAAVLSSIRADSAEQLLRNYVALPSSDRLPSILRQLAVSAVRLGRRADIDHVLRMVVFDELLANDFLLLARTLDAADARIADHNVEFAADLSRRIEELHNAARQDLNASSLALLGRYRGRATQALLASSSRKTVSEEQIISAMGGLLTARKPVDTQLAAIEALARTRHPDSGVLLLNRYRQVSANAQEAILEKLLSRSEWSLALLNRIAEGGLPRGLLNASRRAKLFSHADESIRLQAAKVLEMTGSSRTKVIEKYRSVIAQIPDQEPDIDQGRALFRKHCSACHKLEGHGHVVGPELQALTNRDPVWLLTAILDPNRDVDARYVSWSALSEDGRLVTGLVIEESASKVLLRESGGKEHELLRAEIEQFRASNVSLMPEGLEKEIDPSAMNNLLAYVARSIGSTQTRVRAVSLPRYPAEIAPFLLDQSQSKERRQQAIDRRPGMGPGIIGLLVKDVPAGDNTQNNRMPWIFRTALAVGRRNDGGEIRDLLELSMPPADRPLDKWQVVVIGGGIINGITQIGQWPGRRIDSILLGTPSLRPRWQRTLKLAVKMAEDENVRLGTRYDALRIIALSDPSTAIGHLSTYLSEDSDRQLQMGAVSGLSDIESSEVAPLLISSLSFLDARNRKLAIAGLLRTEKRRAKLQQAMDEDKKLVRPSEL